jgi:hypothetical protein
MQTHKKTPSREKGAIIGLLIQPLLFFMIQARN